MEKPIELCIRCNTMRTDSQASDFIRHALSPRRDAIPSSVAKRRYWAGG